MCRPIYFIFRMLGFLIGHFCHIFVALFNVPYQTLPVAKFFFADWTDELLLMCMRC